ncbi:GRIP1-associated protein 1-like isoform X2 [Hoplias malabaricus]|uniref:GRIP1-associated protein 1-like isoform X2 n=1 Tax=Hoplias malabaricus TaxID=27720 RepID=UPI003462EB0B
MSMINQHWLLAIFMAVVSCGALNELSADVLTHRFMKTAEEEDRAMLDQLSNQEETCAMPLCPSTVDRPLAPVLMDDSDHQFRSFHEDERNEVLESLFLVGYDAVYVSEQDEIQNSSNMNTEEKENFSEVVQTMRRLKGLNKNLQKSLDMSEDCNTVLRAEVTSLKNQIKTLKQFGQDDRNLKDELDTLRAEKLEQEQLYSTYEACKRQLEKQNETLKNKVEAISSEITSVLGEKDMFKERTEELSQLLMALQQEMEENNLHYTRTNELIQQKEVLIKQLEETIADYRTIKQDMQEKIQDLEGQLALALVNGSGGTFMNIDNTLPEDIQHSVSLGEELGLLSGCQMAFPSEDEEKEEGNGTQQHTIEDEWRENEDEAKIENVKHTKESMIVEVETSQSDCPARWLVKSGRHIKKGAHAAGLLGIGTLVPLCLVRTFAPVISDWVGLSCADLIWNLARGLIEPYCSIYHIGLPPV